MMKKYRITTLLFFALLGFFSCVCKNPQFIHMSFCDVFSFPPDQEGQKKDSSVMSRNIYYLIDESDKRCYSDSTIRNYMKTDRFIQSEIEYNYNLMNITFYHKSLNTDRVMEMKSDHFLSDCNDDIVAEYHWRGGKFSGGDLYENGIIIGTDKIKIEDIKVQNENNK